MLQRFSPPAELNQDGRGPKWIIMHEACNNWTLEYVSCDEQRDLIDDVLLEHIRECGRIRFLMNSEIVDEPWDEITAEYWPRIQSGELTIKGAYEEHDKKTAERKERASDRV